MLRLSEESNLAGCGTGAERRFCVECGAALAMTCAWRGATNEPGGKFRGRGEA